MDVFASSAHASTLADVKMSLNKYHALLHYSQLTHTSLAALPLSPSPTPTSLLPSLLKSLLLLSLRVTLSLPLLLAHAPGYLFGSLAARLAGDEEEARAQYKVIFGGLGVALGVGLEAALLFQPGKRNVSGGWSGAQPSLLALAAGLQRVLGVIGTGWILCRLHTMFIDGTSSAFVRLICRS